MPRLSLLIAAASMLATLLRAQAPPEGPLPPVRLGGHCFQHNNRPFIPFTAPPAPFGGEIVEYQEPQR
jgi:hypothetical protein